MEKVNLELANKYIDIYNESSEYEHYRIEEKALNTIFQTYSKNNKLEHILIKVVLLNKFYSTNIMAPRIVADKIFELKIDDELEQGNLDLIDKIATNVFKNEETGEEKIKKFYSFATKYCHKSKPDKYPIYDSNVAYILKAYRKEDSYFKFKNNDLKYYPEFKNIIDNFRCHYKLDALNYRDLDHFLWIYGKEEQKQNNNNEK